MKMLRTKKLWLLLLSGVIVLGIMSSCAHKSYTEEELGLRKETLYDEASTVPVKGEPMGKDAGENKMIERAFENSPPLIPHDLTGFLPIVRPDTDNMCMECHMPEEAVGTGATPIPKSHLVDLVSGKDLGGNIAGSRFNCMQCHVSQTTVSPAIENLFKGEFRDEKSRYRSNLIEILNEGVEAE
jgi:cytochrome c-type protein NapB